MTGTKPILLDPKTAEGKYSDVIETARWLANEGDYGTAPNALAVMVRESDTFRRAQRKIAQG